MLDIMIPAWIGENLTPVEKLEVHKRGLRHKAVSVFILHDRKILLQQRALGKYHTPGLWANTCCTHPDWGEDPLACAVRRLDQELGIKGLIPEHRHQLEYRAEVGNGLTEHEVVDVFLSTTDTLPNVDPNPDEVIDTQWISYDDLQDALQRYPEKFTPWLRIYMSEHAAVIFGNALTAPSDD